MPKRVFGFVGASGVVLSRNKPRIECKLFFNFYTGARHRVTTSPLRLRHQDARRRWLVSADASPLLVAAAAAAAAAAVRRQCAGQWCGECLLYADNRGLTRLQCPGSLQRGNGGRGLCRTVHLGKNRRPRGGEARDLTDIKGRASCAVCKHTRCKLGRAGCSQRRWGPVQELKDGGR